MWLSKNRLGIWYARGADKNGRPISRSMRTKDKREAEKKMRAELKRRLEAPAVESESPLLSDFTKSVLTERYAQAPDKTREWMRLGLEHLQAHAGDIRLDLIDYTVIDKLKAERAAVVSAKTVNLNLQAIRAALRWAKKRGWVREVPEVELLSVPRLKPRWLSKEEIGSLLRDAAGTRMERFLTVMLYAGLRPGEALRLKWNEVHLLAPQPFLLVRMPAKRDRKTGAIKDQEERTVPLHPELKAKLEYWVPGASERVAAVSAMTVRRFFAKRWPDGSITPHKLRHTFASHFVMDTQDLAALQEILGHSDVKVTRDNYAHLNLAHKGQQMARMTLVNVSPNVSPMPTYKNGANN